MWLYNKKLCYNTFRMNHTIKHANAENHSCTVVLKRLILKEILSANFWHFTFIYTRKEGSNERINLTKKVCMQKTSSKLQFCGNLNAFSGITGLWGQRLNLLKILPSDNLISCVLMLSGEQHTWGKWKRKRLSSIMLTFFLVFWMI